MDKICFKMLEGIPEKQNFPQLIAYSEICNFPKVPVFLYCVFPLLFVIGGIKNSSENLILKLIIYKSLSCTQQLPEHLRF